MSQKETGLRIEALDNPACYPHPVDSVERIETHGNWILLAGEYAYKIKKPVDLGFMDFTSLEKRRFYCEEEIRLNRRLAPALYHRVVNISGTAEAPRIDGDGEPFEYAVLMSRFDHGQRLDHRLARGELIPESLDELARDIAVFHADAPAATPDGDTEPQYGDPAALQAMAADNFRDCCRLLPETDHPRLQSVEALSEARFKALAEQLESRRREGRVRECHGDLHLGNLVFHQNRIQAFDCIEFNPDFRWIDTANEVAFLSMDLKYRGRPDLVSRWLNAYLEASGDHQAIPLLGFYEAYRAMIRAKVNLIRASQHPDSEAADTERQAARDYIELARASLKPGQGRILITMGLSASGKSHIAQQLIQALPALRLRSDVERKRLFGLDPLQASGAEVDAGIYTPEASRQTYQRLADLALLIARAGYTVIVDATFLQRPGRDHFRQLASDNNLGFAILHTHAPIDVLETRIKKRQATGKDPSEANIEVLHVQHQRMDPITETEAPYALDIDTTQALSPAALAKRVRDLEQG
ncbi:AAA family ATPase [Gammaproteobacteria bacterium AB-CW1]|uniref:AAA family ATPase n=1 Tax=Natronospira elongata TaxID=3110268 RepID=A0AAP6MNJ3_9GAMM|nr:AAA family ATPase [Gammaproteobacteria bacterium AB-CW1]